MKANDPVDDEADVGAVPDELALATAGTVLVVVVVQIVVVVVEAGSVVVVVEGSVEAVVLVARNESSVVVVVDVLVDVVVVGLVVDVVDVVVVGVVVDVVVVLEHGSVVVVDEVLVGLVVDVVDEVDVVDVVEVLVVVDVVEAAAWMTPGDIADGPAAAPAESGKAGIRLTTATTDTASQPARRSIPMSSLLSRAPEPFRASESRTPGVRSDASHWCTEARTGEVTVMTRKGERFATTGPVGDLTPQGPGPAVRLTPRGVLTRSSC